MVFVKRLGVRSVLAIVTVAVLLLSGCASKPKGISSTDPPVPTDAIVTDNTGSIAGVVVTEEVVPIAGAQLLVQETQDSARTAQDGRFAINGVAPGTYSVLISALGYDAQASRVEVVAGQVTEKTFTMSAIVVKVPFHESRPFAGRFECSTAFVDVLWAQCPGASALAPDSSSSISFDKPTGVTHLVAELRWTQASGGTGQNLDFNLVEQGRDEEQWYANVYGPSPLKIVIQVGEKFENPESPGGGVGSSDFDQVVDDEDTALQLDIYSSPVYADEVVSGAERVALVGVTLQQPFEGYLTFFYDEVPAEDFSAFADA